jgi:hypothetical protein
LIASIAFIKREREVESDSVDIDRSAVDRYDQIIESVQASWGLPILEKMEFFKIYFEIVVDSRISLWNLNRIYSCLSDFAGLPQTAGEFCIKNSNFLNVQLWTS